MRTEQTRRFYARGDAGDARVLLIGSQLLYDYGRYFAAHGAATPGEWAGHAMCHRLAR